MPQISVIIPVYNVKDYLEDCLNSILQQTFRDFEIILVDDGSSDGSSELCEVLKNTHPCIRVIHKKMEVRQVQGIWVLIRQEENSLPLLMQTTNCMKMPMKP